MYSFSLTHARLPTHENHLWLLVIEKCFIHAFSHIGIINVTSFWYELRYKLQMTNLFISHDLWYPVNRFLLNEFPTQFSLNEWMERSKISNRFQLSDLLLSTLCAALKLGDITNDKISPTLSAHQKWMKLSVILHYIDIDSEQAREGKFGCVEVKQIKSNKF